MSNLRTSPIKKAIGNDVVCTTDYEYDDTGLPKSNVVKYELSDEKTYFIVRPSGTEPKIKLYIGTCADSMEQGNALIDELVEDVKKQMGI